MIEFKDNPTIFLHVAKDDSPLAPWVDYRELDVDDLNLLLDAMDAFDFVQPSRQLHDLQNMILDIREAFMNKLEETKEQ